jgi:hypothetical protein
MESLGNRTWRAVGYQQFAAGAVDASTALTVPPGAVLAIITCEAQAIRWRDDDVAPTTTVGMPQAVGAIFNYMGDLARYRVISAVAGAIVNVSYYAQG